jgi:hypothetical protein
MIRAPLLPLFLAAATSFAWAQSKDDDEVTKVPADPFTEGDAESMAALGIVRYGPLPWADNLRTADVDKVLGEGRILWMETEHFAIGSNLKTVAVPEDPKARKLTNEELKRLNKKCSKIPSRSSKLSPWLRLHLYAQRAEDLYAEFAVLAGKRDGGKVLGQDKKILLLLFDKKSDLSRYLDRFCGHRTDFSMRHYHGNSGHYSLVMMAEGDDGPRDAAALHVQFRFMLVQLFHEVAGGAPMWLTYGLAHHFEREVPSNQINVGIRADESVDPMTQHKWHDKMQARVKHEALCIPFAELSGKTDFGYYEHLQAWSRVDFLLQRDRQKFAEYLSTLLGSYGKERQFQALELIFGLTPEQFDVEWRKWVQKTY